MVVRPPFPLMQLACACDPAAAAPASATAPSQKLLEQQRQQQRQQHLQEQQLQQLKLQQQVMQQRNACITSHVATPGLSEPSVRLLPHIAVEAGAAAAATLAQIKTAAGAAFPVACDQDCAAGAASGHTAAAAGDPPQQQQKQQFQQQQQQQQLAGESGHMRLGQTDVGVEGVTDTGGV
ncbi:hypothetical protein EBH_0002670 [Eimeria brunetti]|uniref:Uncharacterized protein n=1 Tax=Eimeria brunetti TaxID=51314 RepID=U6LS01_9EIME|nr:hypothetical protein EBH_0002670 [Eimeria brunetti]